MKYNKLTKKFFAKAARERRNQNIRKTINYHPMNRRVIRLECNQIICSLVTQHTDGKKDTKETEGSDKIFSGEVLQKIRSLVKAGKLDLQLQF